MPREPDPEPAISRNLESEYRKIFAKWKFGEPQFDKRLQSLLGYGYIGRKQRRYRHQLSYDIPYGVTKIISLYLEVYTRSYAELSKEYSMFNCERSECID